MPTGKFFNLPNKSADSFSGGETFISRAVRSRRCALASLIALPFSNDFAASRCISLYFRPLKIHLSSKFDSTKLIVNRSFYDDKSSITVLSD